MPPSHFRDFSTDPSEKGKRGDHGCLAQTHHRFHYPGGFN